MTDTEYLDGFTGELLHINEVADNKLIDLGASGGSGTYFLTHTCIDLSAYALKVISERIGKTGNTVLLNSAVSGGEQRVNRHLNTFEWAAYDGGADVKALHAFIANARKDLIARGNNPLFLSVGALKWRVTVKERGKEILKDVTTPLLIFPVKLIASGNSSPVAIEFIDDEIYVNPCLVAKLAQIFGEELVNGLPKIGGTAELGAPVDLALLGDGAEYFKAMTAYIQSCNHTDGADSTRFEFDKDCIAIAQYKHDELCTYYDIRRNKEKIYTHPLVGRLFSQSSPAERKAGEVALPDYVLQRDSVQEKIISRVVNGESIIIKGPPGTGKTVTIANMIATLMSRNKRVIFASKKLSALTEVYAKLPERLRKFTLLLDSETESKAAKLRPDDLKQDFKRLLNDCKEYRRPPQLEEDLKHTAAERSKAMRMLSAYIELMFRDDYITEGSFYSALDVFCKIDMPVIEIADEAQVTATTRAQYNHMATLADEAQKHFAVLTGEGAHPVFKCPWFGIDLSCNSEKAMADCVAIGKNAEYVYGLIADGLSDCGLSADLFTLAQVESVARCTLGEDRLTAMVASEECGEVIENVRRRLCDLLALPAGEVDCDVKVPATELLEARVIKLGALNVDKSLNLGQMRLIGGCAEIFTVDGKPLSGEAVSLLSKTCDVLEAEESAIIERVARSREVFRSDLSDEQLRDILNAASALGTYFENCPTKPKALDFKAKKAYSKLVAYSYLSAPSFIDIVKAVKEYAAASVHERKVAENVESMYRFFHRQLTPEQVLCLRLVIKKCSGAHSDVCAYVKSVTDNLEFIAECYSYLAAKDTANVTFGGLAACYESAYRKQLLCSGLEALNAFVAVYSGGNSENAVEIAQSVIGAWEFIKACRAQNADKDNTVKAITMLRSAGKQLNAKIDGIATALDNFGREHFRSYYVINGEDNSFGDMHILADEAGDRDVIAAAASYTALKSHPQNAFNLSAFLYWFEKGGKLPDGATFKDAFEHSFFALAIRARDSELGIVRNGMGARTENNLEKLAAADEKLNELNAQVIEGKCFARIKPADDDFIFIQDRNPNENLRLMFKRHASALLKLTKCFILSPYTASLLFTNDEFDNFDVLIVDEASQLEPALVLPVLFRSKQCVIVGDEWQMPPIKHFTTLAPVTDDSGEGYGALEPEISVLGLALRNEGFPVEELICHYRSMTESLIKFSQESFYPNMRTFPAPVPATVAQKGVSGLGLRDVYVPEGFVSLGRNKAEADKVVEELKRHFENYYDEKSHTLSMSVGVIAFGEAQCSAIEERVRADKQLSKQISDALEHFDDLPEKLIFFKTIETVQGQEVGHVILSITHGKRESGLHMHFGQLNQGKLGKCIFNVAVTRAQSMVTVVHSVRAAEVTGENVTYIREYLETVARFGEADSEQFVCGSVGKGFISDVCAYVRSCGIESERIVTDYGVTEGSVRIPIAVLSKDLKRALLGIWCERPVGAKYDYLDYNMRYKNSLIARGWKLHTVYAHDWADNRQNEQEALKKALMTIINNEENN